MKEVELVPPKKMLPPHMRRLRVAAYCRVSTQAEEQQQSFDIQMVYYTKTLDNHPVWKNAGVFGDVGSGLGSRKRTEFQKMMALCRKGVVDLVLTKSISRFGRNFLESAVALRELDSLGIDVWFESEDIRLQDPDTRQTIELFCIMAQAESESTSKNIKLGIRYGFKRGTSKWYAHPCYGYMKDDNGELVPDPATAPVVELIFKLYLEGKSTGKIAKELLRRGIQSPTGKISWSRSVLDRLLSNEKYIGNVLLQKTFVADLFDGKQVKNTGQLEQYQLEDVHPAIISREDFEAVQLRKPGN